MSSRQLRKLQKQRELEKLNTASEQDDEESSEDEGPKAVEAKPRVSLFAALGGEEDDNDDDEEEKQQSDEVKEEEVAQPAQPSTKSSRKKKKKKKKNTKSNAAPSAETPEGPDVAEEDEIDRAIKELKLSGKQGAGSTGPGGAGGAAAKRINQLLSINTQHLKAMNEMRSLFGRDVIESANAEEEQQQQENARRRRGGMQRQVDLETFLRGPPGAKRLPEVSLRRNVFIQGREHWPRQTAGGLTMKQIRKADDGSFTEYAYVHDKEYDAVQTFFFSCVQMGDPMRIVYLLQQVRTSRDAFA